MTHKSVVRVKKILNGVFISEKELIEYIIVGLTVVVCKLKKILSHEQSHFANLESRIFTDPYLMRYGNPKFILLKNMHRTFV